MRQSNNLALYRQRRGFERKALAEIMGVTSNYIYMIEAGHRNPGFRLSKRFADFFNTSIEELFFNKTAGSEVKN